MKHIHKCEGCGGKLLFDPETQRLTCEYCGSKYNLTEVKNATPIKRKYSDKLKYEEVKDSNHLYECVACGTKISAHIDNNVKRCPSCGSSSVREIKESLIHPMNMIPFSVSKDKASMLYEKWLSTRKFTPSNLKTMARLKKVTGLYAPIYTYDLTATTHYSATCTEEDKNSDGTISTWTTHVSDTQVTKYDDYIDSANAKMSPSLFKHTYDFSDKCIVPYSDEYMLGFVGIGTDYTAKQSFDKVYEDIENIEQSDIRSRLRMKYDDVDFFNADTTITNVNTSYLYVPLWVNNYTYKNKNYNCYINGQTGQVFGSTPTSFWKVLGIVLIALIAIGLIAGLATM